MNIAEWNKACDEGWAPRRYDNASREIQKTLKYNSNPDATTRHHLRDTEEQRKYNDDHYELWGFEIDENGNEHFEYGKYVVFVTDEEHKAIHRVSEETREKMSKSNKKKWEDPEYRKSKITAFIKMWGEDDRRQKRSDAYKGEGNPFYGKTHSAETREKLSKAAKGRTVSDETKKKLSIASKGRHHTEETKEKISIALKDKPKSDQHRQHWLESMSTEESKRKQRESRLGEKNPMYGKHPSDETRKKLSEAIKASRTDDVKRKIGKNSRDRMTIMKHAYALYKSNNGELKWNDFQKICIVNVETNTYVLKED